MSAPWTPQQRRNSRATYQRLYQHDGGTAVRPVTVPDDVERVEVSAPCFMCGTARGPCRHREAA